MVSPQSGFTISRKYDDTEVACRVRKITKDTKVKPITADEVLKLKAGPKITTHTTSNNLARGANAKRLRESEIAVSSSTFAKKQAVQMLTKFSSREFPPGFATNKSMPVRLTSGTAANSEKSRPSFASNQFMPARLTPAVGAKSAKAPLGFASNQWEPARLTSPTGAHSEKSPPDFGSNQFTPTKRTSAIGAKYPKAPPDFASNQCKPARLTSPTGAHSEKSPPDFNPNQFMPAKLTSAIGAKRAKPPPGFASNQCEPARLTSPTGAYSEKSPPDVSSNQFMPERLTSAAGANSEKLPLDFASNQFMPARLTSAVVANTEECPPGFTPHRFMPARFTSTGENSVKPPPGFASSKFSSARLTSTSGENGRFGKAADAKLRSLDSIPDELGSVCKFSLVRCYTDNADDEKVNQGLGLGLIKEEASLTSTSGENGRFGKAADAKLRSLDSIPDELGSVCKFSSVRCYTDNADDEKVNQGLELGLIKEENSTVPAEVVKDSSYRTKHQAHNSSPLLLVKSPLSGFGSVPLEDFIPSNNPAYATIPAKKVKTSCDGIKQKGNNSAPLLLVTPSLSGASPHGAVIKENDSQVAKPKLQKYPPIGPALEVVWKGNFELLDAEKVRDVPVNVKLCEEFVAHPPTMVSRRAYKFTKQMAGVMQFKLHSRLSIWPESFQEDTPDMKDVALYLYPGNFERSRRNYSILLKYLEKNDMALKSQMGSTELLIFASKLLPPDSQKLKGSFFMWGVFHRSRGRQTG